MLKWPLAKPHQIEGAEYFAEDGRGVLGDEMGLGKGLTSLIWLDKVGAKRILYVSIKEITSNLVREIPKWVNTPLFDLRGYKVHERETLFEILTDFEEMICVVNIEAWRVDKTFVEKLIALKFDAIVMDEAHHLNNGSNVSYKGVREIINAINQCHKCKRDVHPKYLCKRNNCVMQYERTQFRYCWECGQINTKIVIPPCANCGADNNARPKLSRSIQYVLGMTGTILVNKPDDVFWVFHLIAPEDFLTIKRFKDEFCVLRNGRWVWKEGAKENLARVISGYYLARTKKDAGVILPPQTITPYEYEFDRKNYREQWDAYQRLETEFYIELEDETVGVTEVVTQILRLRQMLVWPNSIPGVSISKSFKMDIAEKKLIELLEAGQRVVAFSHFREPLRELQRRLGDVSVVYDGSTPPKQRKAIKEEFGPESLGRATRWDVALCNYKTAGEGLNLVGASQTFIIDEDWSPAKNSQTYGRTDRMGQTLETGVHIPRILETVDEWMLELNKFKAEQVAVFNDAATLNRQLREAIKNKTKRK